VKKDDNQNQSSNIVGFWFCAGLLAVLLASILARDITRPFYGLHSWADAHSSWAARVHLKYGLGYTKGFSVRTVGYPPVENPYRYLDHPQLTSLLNAAAMAVLGVHTWSLRALNLTTTIITLLLFLKILRGLLDDRTALLAGLFFCLFPVIGYFGVILWLYPLTFLAILCYLKLIKEIESDPKRKSLYSFGLAFGLFFALQVSWEGFFFAMAIGVHYVCRCIHRRTFPAKSLLAILIIAPLGSLALNFIIMAAGHGWDFQKIIDLYKWRAGAAEVGTHDWGDWFAKFWEFAQTNFTLPILITTIVYLTIGQLFVFMEPKPEKEHKCRPRQFPQFFLFLMPPVFQLFLLKGCLWKHQTWERPFCFFIAIAAAQGVMLLGDVLKKINKKAAYTAMTVMVAVISIFCIKGVSYYYGIRWQSPAKIKMFEMLKKKMPPDKALLSFEPFVVDQHSAKGAFYRPEIAWHLDRDIVQVRSFTEIQKYAQTGRYPYYLVPVVDQLAPLTSQLRKYYKFDYVPGNPGQTKYGKFYRAGMYPYMIFDLRSKADG